MRKSKTTWSRTDVPLPAGSHPALGAILDCLKAVEEETGQPVLRDTLVFRLPSFLAQHRVPTTQKAQRVLYYWRKALVSAGYVKVGRVD